MTLFKSIICRLVVLLFFLNACSDTNSPYSVESGAKDPTDEKSIKHFTDRAKISGQDLNKSFKIIDKKYVRAIPILPFPSDLRPKSSND
jgi:hypothetical protein